MSATNASNPQIRTYFTVFSSPKGVPGASSALGGRGYTHQIEGFSFFLKSETQFMHEHAIVEDMQPQEECNKQSKINTSKRGIYKPNG